eukprot:7628250-Pyramimonas_sp.AAC.1
MVYSRGQKWVVFEGAGTVYDDNITSFYGSFCANNVKGALDTRRSPSPFLTAYPVPHEGREPDVCCGTYGRTPGVLQIANKGAVTVEGVSLWRPRQRLQVRLVIDEQGTTADGRDFTLTGSFSQEVCAGR